MSLRSEAENFRRFLKQQSESRRLETRRAYNQRPDIKAKMRAYFQRPDIKAKKRAYNQRPDIKAKMRAKYRANRRKIKAALDFYLKHKGE